MIDGIWFYNNKDIRTSYKPSHDEISYYDFLTDKYPKSELSNKKIRD